MTATKQIKPTIGYSYLRFSSSAQKWTESLNRQRKATEEFCKTHNITLVEEMKALGVSAFRGKNLDDTSILGEFLKRIKEGKIPNDGSACLIVESFDRISRDKVLRAQQVMADVITNGVSIAPLSFNGIILSEETIAANPSLLLMAIVEQMRGNNESQLKSDRVMDNFNKKYDRLAKGEKVYFGSFMPSWITGLQHGKWVKDEARVAVVKRIFAEFNAGRSFNQIAVGLNADAKLGKVISCLRVRSKKAHWERPTIKGILTNPTVVGTFSVKGKEYPDYLPRIISQADFDIAQLRIKQNSTRRGGNTNGDVTTVLRGNVCKCQHCQGVIGVLSQHDHENRRYVYIGCLNARKGTCDAKLRFRMDEVEKTLFGHCLVYAPSDFLAHDAKEGMKRMEALQAEQEAITKRINKVIAVMDEDTAVPELKEKLTGLQQRRKAITEEIKALNISASAATVVPSAAKTFSQLIHQDLEDMDIRKQLVPIIPTIFKRIDFHLKDYKDFTVHFCNGDKWSYTEAIEEYAIDTKGKLHPLEIKRSTFDMNGN